MNIDDWREPTFKTVSFEQSPPDHSSDNGVLFTMEALALDLVTFREASDIYMSYEMDFGLVSRYPGTNDPCSIDDHLGAASLSPKTASRILFYMESHQWTTPSGDKLWRFPIFKAAIKAGAMMPLTIVDQLLASVAYLWNMTESRDQTSGKILLWLASRNLKHYFITRQAIKIWKWNMMKKYPNGMKDVMGIYFNKPGHPFPQAARSDFE